LAVIARLDRAIQYAAASRFITKASGILDHPLSRVMTAIGVLPRFRGDDDRFNERRPRVLAIAPARL
jgi:hypothetical protein